MDVMKRKHFLEETRKNDVFQRHQPVPTTPDEQMTDYDEFVI